MTEAEQEQINAGLRLVASAAKAMRFGGQIVLTVNDDGEVYVEFPRQHEVSRDESIDAYEVTHVDGQRRGKRCQTPGSVMRGLAGHA